MMHKKSWDDRFGQLLDYRRNFGHCNVTFVDPMAEARSKRVRGHANGADFNEEGNDIKDEVDENEEDLITDSGTKSRCPDGICNSAIDRRAFGRWIKQQRADYVKFMHGKKVKALDKNRIRRLNEVGFDWGYAVEAAKREPTPSRGPGAKQNRVAWDARFSQLCEFVTTHGEDCHKMESGTCLLRSEFPFSDTSLRNLISLPTYYQIYFLGEGNTRVPQGWKENPQLAHWVAEQRKQYRFRSLSRPNSMSDERIARLEGFDFEWSIQDHSRRWAKGRGEKKMIEEEEDSEDGAVDEEAERSYPWYDKQQNQGLSAPQQNTEYGDPVSAMNHQVPQQLGYQTINRWGC
mmetsp:Transcript_35054/g.104592  ORF Transcript_35054/g.104592 Transcript_35054/m.104592 type:complete len:347 (-) Transcript_35054:122-1162(-)